MEILKCVNIKKEIDKSKIVNNISFSVHKGDIIGLIGPNGAGKTTIIKLILGLLKMNEGQIYINGYDIKKDFEKAIEKVGAIVETPDLYMYLSGYDNLKITANYYKDISKERINEVIKIVGLENRIKDKVSTYSLGMRQRLGIAEAIMNKPKLLILDEPTNGLDIDGIIEIRNLIKKLSKNGTSIIISSHNLKEVDNLCNRIILLKEGKIIFDDSIENFSNFSAKSIWILELNNNNNIEKILKGYQFETIGKNKVRINTTKENISMVTKELITNDYEIYSVKEEGLSIEEVFIKKVGENKIV